MTDIAQLRASIERAEQAWEMGLYADLPGLFTADSERLLAAARELLTLKEAGALIITPDENGNLPELYVRTTWGCDADHYGKVKCAPDTTWKHAGCGWIYERFALRNATPDGETR